MFLGILILLMGVLMLLSQLGLITGSFWKWFWPVVIIAIGISMLSKHFMRRKVM